ncbi:MAG: MFS transporter [Pyrinomonadaceae bacterium]|nr:MFS transporter [Pyrinomonadaceae bacterium]
MQNQIEKTPAYSYYALGLLTFVYVMNFLDRQIIYILFPLIKKEMAFTDTQLALLGGTSFAIFYTLLGIPFGRLADKTSRTKLIAIGLATWSLFSGLTGFADGFWTLFACRVMVGVGEATLGPAAISLLIDYFPPTKRATVTSIYSMGIAVGAGFAALAGGYLSQFGWREAFFIVGFPGTIFAVLVFLMREPQRTRPANAAEENYASAADWKSLLSNRAFIFLCLGYAFFGLATNNISIWGASYFSRLYNVSLANFGYWAGIFTLAAGIPATLFGGAIADWFRRKRSGGRMFYGMILSLVSIPCWFVALFSDNFYLILPAGFVLLFAALAWLGAAAADATEIAGANLRGLAVAIYFFTVNIAAYLIGAPLIGKLSDLAGIITNPQTGVTENAEMMRYTLLICPFSCLMAAICLWFGSRSLSASEQ